MAFFVCKFVNTSPCEQSKYKKELHNHNWNKKYASVYSLGLLSVGLVSALFGWIQTASKCGFVHEEHRAFLF